MIRRVLFDFIAPVVWLGTAWVSVYCSGSYAVMAERWEWCAEMWDKPPLSASPVSTDMAASNTRMAASCRRQSTVFGGLAVLQVGVSFCHTVNRCRTKG